MKLATALIRLRPFYRQDRDLTLAWRNTPAIRDAAMGFRFPVTDVMEDRWFDRVLDGNDKSRVYFAIESVEDTTLIGFSSLVDIDYQSSNAQFGIMIGDTSRHKAGMGTDALKLTLSFAFKSLNLNRVYVFVRERNIAASKLFSRLGFQQEGVLKEHYFVDGEREDVHVKALLKRQFESK